MTETAEHVSVVLEQIRIDRSDPDALAGRKLVQPLPVIHPVPRNVERHARAYASQLVDHRRIGELLLDRSRGSGLCKYFESRPRVAVAPRRRLDLEAVDALNDSVSQGETTPSGPHENRFRAGYLVP